MPNTSYEVSRRYLLDEIIDFGKISNSFEQHSVSFMTILPPGIYTPADGQYVDMVFDKIVVDCQGDFIYYGNQDRLLEVYDGRGGGWIDQSFRDIEFLPNTYVGEFFYQLLTECANNDDLPQPPRWQTSVKQIDLNRFLADKVHEEFIPGIYHNVQVIAHSDNEYFDTSDPSDLFDFRATEAYNKNGGLYDENGVNIVSWETLVDVYEMAIHEIDPEAKPDNTGNPTHALEEYIYTYRDEPNPNWYEPNAVWLGNIAFNTFPEACTLVIPEGVTYVRENLLANISLCLPANDLNITTLYLPSTVEKIGKNAFIGSKLTKIYYNGDSKSWSQIHFVNRYSNPCAAAYIHLLGKTGKIDNLQGVRIMPEKLFAYRHRRDEVSEFLDIDNGSFNPFMLFPDFYIKPTPESDYQPLVEIDIQETQSTERIRISAYAFAGCGKHVEKITLDKAVSYIGRHAFDLFMAYRNGSAKLPVCFYYNGTLEEWMSTELRSKLSNPGYLARYIDIKDSDIRGIDDEENPCPIQTLHVSLSRSMRSIGCYMFTGWHADVFKFSVDISDPDIIKYYTIRAYAFANTDFKEVIIDTTPEIWGKLRFSNHKTANPLWRWTTTRNVFIYDADLDDYVKFDSTVYVPQRSTSVRAYKYANLGLIEKVYIPPSVALIHRDAFINCQYLKLVDCTACMDGLPKIRRPLSHPKLKDTTPGHPDYIPSPFMVESQISDRPTILIPRDRSGAAWEYLGDKIRKDISGEMNHWECCDIEHATSNLSTSTAINIKIYNVYANPTLSVKIKNIPGMTVDWGDGSLMYKHATSQLTESEYITHTYQNFRVQNGYNCDARTIRIYDVDNIPSDFFELNTNMPQHVGIATLTIANGIKSIGKNAFGNILNWARLENIYISNTVLFIDQGAFGDSMREDAFVVFEDADASTYPWYSTPQANTFTASDERLSIDPLSCFESYAESDGTSQNSGMLSAVMAEGKVLYRYSSEPQYRTLSILANKSSVAISIGRGARDLTLVAISPSVPASSLETVYDPMTGVLKVSVINGAADTTYIIKYSYTVPEYLIQSS